MGDPFDAGAGSILRQPKAVWATAGASVVAFMGIELVDPILPSIAKGLDATAGQVSLLCSPSSRCSWPRVCSGASAR